MRYILIRHFFGGLLRPETASGDDSFVEWLAQMLGALIAASWLFPVYFLQARYAALHAQPGPERYLLAARGDFLMMLCLLSLLVALVTAIEWPMLFPSRRDHLVLSPLPLSRRRLFGAKLAAVLLFVSLFIAATAVVTGVTLPAIATGAHEPRGFFPRLAAHVAGAVSACYFVFFALFAGQGLMAFLLPSRWFAPASFAVQSALLVTAICGFPLLPYFPATLLLNAAWLPPAWFAAITEALLGQPSPLAVRGAVALALAVGLTLVTYFLAYLRFSQHALEGSKASRPPRWRWPGAGVTRFLLATLARGRDQKLVWLLVGALGIALLVENSVYLARRIDRHGWDAIAASARGSVLGVPLMLCYFTLAGLRRAFRLPADPAANWLFRFAETPAHRRAWLDSAWRVLAGLGGVGVLALCLPAHVILLGPAQGALVAFWQLLMVLALANFWLTGWNTVPFTSTHNPAQRHLLHSLLAHLALFVPFVFGGAMLMGEALADSSLAAAWTGALVVALCLARAGRLRHWGAEPLQFAEPDDPGVSPLRLS